MRHQFFLFRLNSKCLKSALPLCPMNSSLQCFPRYLQPSPYHRQKCSPPLWSDFLGIQTLRWHFRPLRFSAIIDIVISEKFKFKYLLMEAKYAYLWLSFYIRKHVFGIYTGTVGVNDILQPVKVMPYYRTFPRIC